MNNIELINKTINEIEITTKMINDIINSEKKRLIPPNNNYCCYINCKKKANFILCYNYYCWFHINE